MTMSILQVDSNIRTKIQVLGGLPGSKSTSSLSHFSNIFDLVRSPIAYIVVSATLTSQKSDISAEGTIQVNWKCTLDIGLKKKVLLYDFIQMI